MNKDVGRNSTSFAAIQGNSWKKEEMTFKFTAWQMSHFIFIFQTLERLVHSDGNSNKNDFDDDDNDNDNEILLPLMTNLKKSHKKMGQRHKNCCRSWQQQSVESNISSRMYMAKIFHFLMLFSYKDDDDDKDDDISQYDKKSSFTSSLTTHEVMAAAAASAALYEYSSCHGAFYMQIEIFPLPLLFRFKYKVYSSFFFWAD